MIATTTQGSAVRDRSMAENVDWLLSRAGPNARMVLWAHNYHVGRTSVAMGKHLADTHGSAYRNLGFLFGSGTLTAVGPPTNTLRTHSASLVPATSVEAHFIAAGRTLALFDARTLLETGAQPSLREARMRSIGAVFDPSRESTYYSLHRLPEHFDLLIFVATTEASRLLP
jgi:erythromycin esterase